MTDKDPKDMTVSELLRKADSHPCSMCHLVMDGDESCATTGCASWAYRLADKIDAELADARELSLLRGAELWAKANGWPDFREGEDFGAWLERCAIPRPRFEDGEPVQSSDMDEIGTMATYRVYMDGSWEFEPDKYEDERNPKPWDVQFGARNDRVRRPAPEVLGADGLPIKIGETVYSLKDGTAYKVTGLDSSSNLPVAVLSEEFGKLWCKANLTHTPPEAQERIDDDATMPPAEYCAVRGIDLGDDHDREDATVSMVRDLLRRQRELDARKVGE